MALEFLDKNVPLILSGFRFTTSYNSSIALQLPYDNPILLLSIQFSNFIMLYLTIIKNKSFFFIAHNIYETSKNRRKNIAK
jgi:hypothetical protein